MHRMKLVSVALCFGLLAGCSSGEDNGGSGAGGSSAGQAGTTGTAGTTGAAGSTGPAGRGGGPGGAGVSGAAGVVGATGGTGGGAAGSSAGGGSSGGASAGSGGGTAGRGGATGHAGAGGGSAGTTGAAGSSSGAGGSSSTGTPVPSAGCGKSGRPSGGMVQVANTSLYMFPTNYDGTKPYPLLIALHACGNPNTEFVSLTNNTGFATDYVRSFPNTPDSGQCWSNYSGDVSRILSQYDEVMNNYCIDKSRVFAIAHSSGAQMLVNILSHKSDAQHLDLKGISPVAADPYNVAVPMPVLYIDGMMDNQRSADSAKNTVAKFRASNMCSDTSKAYTSIAMCNSTQNGQAVNPGCIIYDNCTVPTIWCSHNDPNYSNTEHGVPCFAMKAMYDFFAGL
jgi:polyhydroxybutyrate depolymerase